MAGFRCSGRTTKTYRVGYPSERDGQGTISIKQRLWQIQIQILKFTRSLLSRNVHKYSYRTQFANTIHSLTIGKDIYWYIYPHIFYIVNLCITERGVWRNKQTKQTNNNRTNPTANHNWWLSTGLIWLELSAMIRTNRRQLLTIDSNFHYVRYNKNWSKPSRSPMSSKYDFKWYPKDVMIQWISEIPYNSCHIFVALYLKDFLTISLQGNGT